MKGYVHATSLAEIFSPDEIEARVTLKSSMGFDAFAQAHIWERVVARMTAGELTPQKAPWDVSLIDGTSVEVKFSTAYPIRFSQGTRQVFRWANAGADRQADAMLLIGMDSDDTIYAWALHPSERTGSKSITITCPNSRRGGSDRTDFLSFPLVEAVGAICHVRWADRHLHYDRQHHARTAGESRRKRRQQALRHHAGTESQAHQKEASG